MATALALMIAAGVINFLHRRKAEQAGVQGMKMTLVPDKGPGGLCRNGCGRLHSGNDGG